MNATAATKINMIKSSQLCLVSGLISLATLIGVPFAVLALAAKGDEPRTFFQFCLFISVLSMGGVPFAAATLVMSTKVRAGERRFWNAARPYRVAGDLCAILAVLAAFIVIGLVCIIFASGDLYRG